MINILEKVVCIIEKLMDNISSIVEKVTNTVVPILENMGIIIIGSLLFPIVFIITLFCLGFTVNGIVAGSSAALWMASLGNVPAGSIFAAVQSLSTQGCLLIIHPYMIVVEFIMGFITMIYTGYVYSFDVNALFHDMMKIMVVFLIIVNYFLSIIIDVSLGVLLSTIFVYILHKLQRNKSNEYTPLLHNTTPEPKLVVFLCPLIGIILGGYVGIVYPFNLFNL